MNDPNNTNDTIYDSDNRDPNPRPRRVVQQQSSGFSLGGVLISLLLLATLVGVSWLIFKTPSVRENQQLITAANSTQEVLVPAVKHIDSLVTAVFTFRQPKVDPKTSLKICVADPTKPQPGGFACLVDPAGNRVYEMETIVIEPLNDVVRTGNLSSLAKAEPNGMGASYSQMLAAAADNSAAAAQTSREVKQVVYPKKAKKTDDQDRVVRLSDYEKGGKLFIEPTITTPVATDAPAPDTTTTPGPQAELHQELVPAPAAPATNP